MIEFELKPHELDIIYALVRHALTNKVPFQGLQELFDKLDAELKIDNAS